MFADPQLLRPVGPDLHARPTSPVLNAGDPSFAPGVNDVDFDGEPRLRGGRVDIGADEVA